MTARVGIIGTGWWATEVHIPSLLGHPGCEVVAFCDASHSKLGLAQRAFGERPAFTDHRELLAAEGLDAVVIATPHASHYEAARDALDAGVHVLVEKPMTLRAAEAWDLCERAHKGGLHLVVGATHQFTPHARIARDLMRTGTLGEVQLVSALLSSMVAPFYEGQPGGRTATPFTVTRPDAQTYSDPARAGGGQAQTQISHIFGMVAHVLDQRVSSVSAYMDNHGLTVDLVDAIAYRLESGTIGTVASTGALHPGQPGQLEVWYYGTEGVLMLDMSAGTLTLDGRHGKRREWPRLSASDLYPTAAPARCLVDLVQGEGTNPSSGRTGAIAVEFLEAAYASTGSRAAGHAEILIG